MISSKTRHIVDPKTEEWYHLDGRYRVWTCDCIKNTGVSLCLSISDELLSEGELREVKSQISRRRKELGLLYDKSS